MKEHPPVVEVENFNLRKGDFSLNDISFTLERGEFFAVLGCTGSGKTLLLESVAGYYKGNSGKVLLSGKPVHSIPPRYRKMGFVYQDYGLFFHMTAAQNIAYGLKCHHVPKTEICCRVEEIAEIMNISHILKERPGVLSGGEKQRIALARALVLKPQVLLLDEPFSAMDPVTRETMYEEISRIRQAFSCAILFVTHDFREAERLADRVGIMLRGELRMIKGRDELFAPSSDFEVDTFLGIKKRA